MRVPCAVQGGLTAGKDRRYGEATSWSTRSNLSAPSGCSAAASGGYHPATTPTHGAATGRHCDGHPSTEAMNLDEVMAAATCLTWPGAFAVVGVALACAGAVWAFCWLMRSLV